MASRRIAWLKHIAQHLKQSNFNVLATPFILSPVAPSLSPNTLLPTFDIFPLLLSDKQPNCLVHSFGTFVLFETSLFPFRRGCTY